MSACPSSPISMLSTSSGACRPPRMWSRLVARGPRRGPRSEVAPRGAARLRRGAGGRGVRGAGRGADVHRDRGVGKGPHACGACPARSSAGSAERVDDPPCLAGRRRRGPGRGRFGVAGRAISCTRTASTRTASTRTGSTRTGSTRTGSTGPASSGGRHRWQERSRRLRARRPPGASARGLRSGQRGGIRPDCGGRQDQRDQCLRAAAGPGRHHRRDHHRRRAAHPAPPCPLPHRPRWALRAHREAEPAESAPPTRSPALGRCSGRGAHPR